MPVGFAGDRMVIGRAEKFYKIYLENIVDTLAFKCFQVSASTPVVDGSFRNLRYVLYFVCLYIFVLFFFQCGFWRFFSSYSNLPEPSGFFVDYT